MNRMQNHYDSAPATQLSQTKMNGFDDEFTDIVDYILRITYRIWEGKQVGLCYDYYSDDCPIYTLAGLTTGSAQVTQNTLDTLAAFPDRTLHADNIIWGGNDQDGFHTSHRICTHMTNHGTSDMGPATGKEATIAVIAHCIVKENKIIEEWLVRDNYSLAEQLGFDPYAVAQQKATSPEPKSFIDWREAELARLDEAVTNERLPYPAKAEEKPEDFIRATLQNIWNARLVGDTCQAYAEQAELHASANRELKGRDEVIQFYIQFLGALSKLKFSLDYICQQPAKEGGVDVAARWTISGNHTGSTLYGEPTQAPILIIGESQYRIEEGVIQEEWTVFDELAILTQIYRKRISQEALSQQTMAAKEMSSSARLEQKAK